MTKTCLGNPASSDPFLSRLLTIDIYLDRPAAKAHALLINYGTSDEACLDVIFGAVQPEGKLPFDLSSLEEAVRSSRSDISFDTRSPTSPFGDELQHGSCSIDI
jgi:beta-glucosidase